jgi:hypothetical protein
MSFIVFENSGEIDVNAISTFGCSVKESENPIGWFGTGLKFALAVLLRTQHKVWIQIGDRQLEVFSEKGTIRGKEFDFVTLSGERLGFTTELGKAWQVWMAYRELYCNAKDEGGHDYATAAVPEPVAGLTRIVVEGDGILECHSRKREFILHGEPAWRLGSVEVYNQPTSSFFYKGIKVGEFQQSALFTYNQTEKVELTEDRTAKNMQGEQWNIAKAMLEFGDRKLLDTVLVAPSDTFEYFLDFHGWGTRPSPDFYDAITALQRSTLVKLNASALRLWQERPGVALDPRCVELTKVQEVMLERALVFCEKSGFDLRGEYPVVIAESLGDVNTLALADTIGKRIFLTTRVFEMQGTKGVASALIEEYIHLRFKLRDNTREMQNFIFDKMISFAEELQGEPL